MHELPPPTRGVPAPTTNSPLQSASRRCTPELCLGHEARDLGEQFRPSALPFAANFHRSLSVSGSRRPLSCVLRTAFSAWRYSMTACCWLFTQPANMTNQNAREMAYSPIAPTPLLHDWDHLHLSEFFWTLRGRGMSCSQKTDGGKEQDGPAQSRRDGAQEYHVVVTASS